MKFSHNYKLPFVILSAAKNLIDRRCFAALSTTNIQGTLRIFAIVLLLAVSIQSLFAQKTQHDVVYLKNGSILKGIITELFPDQELKIEMAGGSFLVVKMTEVEKILKEAIPKEESKKEKVERKPLEIKTKGYYNRTEFGPLYGGTGDFPDSEPALSIQTVNGYKINRYVHLGGGVGVDYYGNYNDGFSLLFGSVSGDLIKHRFTPYYFADAGYGFLWNTGEINQNIDESHHKGGMMIHAGMGLKVYTRHKISFLLGMGYKLQKSVRDYKYASDTFYTYSEKRDYRRISLRFGFSF